MNPSVKKAQDNLRCELTDEELLEYGRAQAKALSDLGKAEDELAAYKTAHKNKVAVLEANIHDISEKIRNGYEFRFVPTEIHTDYEEEIVQFVRMDTGEIYKTRPLNQEERQFKLEFNKDTEGEVEENDATDTESEPEPTEGSEPDIEEGLDPAGDSREPDDSPF